MYHILKNLASNVNLSYCMNLWTLESKLHKNSFSNDLKGHFKVIQVKITKILTFSGFSCSHCFKSGLILWVFLYRYYII